MGVARTLNRLILTGAFDALFKQQLPALRPGLARATIDRALARHIKPGNRLELIDGLFDEGQIESAIAADFGGELDLSVCQAVYLAYFLGKCRSQRVPRPLFSHGTTLLAPHPRLVALHETLKVSAETGMRYFQARTLIEATLMDAFEKTDNDNQRKMPWAWLRS